MLLWHVLFKLRKQEYKSTVIHIFQWSQVKITVDYLL